MECSFLFKVKKDFFHFQKFFYWIENVNSVDIFMWSILHKVLNWFLYKLSVKRVENTFFIPAHKYQTCFGNCHNYSI